MKRFVVVRAPAAIFFLLLGACGGAPSAPDVAPEGIELPTSGILGALPPPEGRVTIVIDADGALTIDGEACTWDQFGDRLGERTAPPRDETAGRRKTTHEEVDTELPAPAPGRVRSLADRLADERKPPPREPEAVAPDGSRNTDALLRIDRRVPWAVVAHVLQTAVHRDRKLWRIFYAVNGEDGRGEGALAVFLPKDRCGQRDEFVEAERVKLRSKKGTGGPASTAHLANTVRSVLPTPKAVLAVDVKGQRDTPYGDMLIAIDAALRAGAAFLGLEGLARLPGTPIEWCEQARAAGPFHWQVVGSPLAGGPAGAAAVPHRSAGYAGVVNDFLNGLLVEVEEEVEER